MRLDRAAIPPIGQGLAVIASIHEKRAEQRAEIKEMGDMTEPPKERGRRFRDA